MLDTNTKAQLQGYLERITQPVEIVASLDDGDASREMLDLLEDIESVSSLVKIDASRFTPVDAALIPTGELKPVQGTPFDFRTPHAIGERIDAKDEQLRLGLGYDHNFVLDHPEGRLSEAAEVYEPTTGRILRVLTTEPAVQLYTGNHLDGSITGKQGVVYKPRFAFCLETQHFPDSPNHPSFPTTALKAGARYHSVTEFRFSTR